MSFDIGPVEIGFLAMAGAGASAIGFMYLRRRGRKKKVSALLDQYKEQVVGYSDAMARIKERHKMLPFTDPDFTAPMIGETLATYEEIETALKTHNDKWLQLMDVWDQADKLLEEDGLRQDNSEAIQQLLEGPDIDAMVAELNQQCNTELDRLEAAHQRVDALMAENKETMASVTDQIDAIREVGLPVDPFDESREEVRLRTEDGERLRTADPLNAELELQQAKTSLQHLHERVEGVLQQRRRADVVAAHRDEAVGAADRHRAAGLRFEEPQGNPDSTLSEAEDCHATAMRVLHQADPSGARGYLDSAEALIEEANEAMQFQAQFRDEGAQRISALQNDVDQLLRDVEQAERDQAELDRSFDPDSWSLVHDNAGEAQELGHAMTQLLEEAARESQWDRQYYYRAQQLIDEVLEQLPEAQQLTVTVSERLQQLRELAQHCATWASDLDAECRRIETVLASNTADRARSNHRFDLASRALTDALERAQYGKPNWPQVERDLLHIEKDLTAVDEMVREDLRLAQQATAEIREASQEVRRCQGFYQQGVSANVGHADGELRSAERALQRQEYEQAIALANSAEESARQSLESARQEAERREREAQRRRNREAAMQMAQVLATAAAQAAIHMGTRRRRRR